jgi:hypothetical protein
MALHQSLERRPVPFGRESVQKLLLAQPRYRPVGKEPFQLMSEPALDPCTKGVHARTAPAPLAIEENRDQSIAANLYCPPAT